jgi:hypothetical protein
VENEFMRARRSQVMARLANRLRRGPDDVNLMLPFDEVIAALGRTSERYIGLQTIRLNSIVGTVDSRHDFDRRFRPTSSRVRARWEHLALAQRRGEAMPPIDVYRVDDLHFVKDGHHRVSIAMTQGQRTIDAYVTEVRTVVPGSGIERRGDLLMKSYEREFRSRVPLPPTAYEHLQVSEPQMYHELGLVVEAWGFRCIQEERNYVERRDVAARWFRDEFTPVIKTLRKAQLLEGLEGDAYLAVARERGELIRATLVRAP